MTTLYESRPIKRTRRTGAQIGDIRQAIRDVLADNNPMTVRQVFYQLVSRGDIEKTEAQYKTTVVRLLTQMRREGQIPFSWIADSTRWMRKPRTYSSLGDMLERSVETYRRAMWDDQDAYVEVWLEKDALAGVLYEITGRYDVPLMVTKGFSSVSYLYEAAEAIQAKGKPAFLYYFGDHDPSGVHIDKHVERTLRELAPDAEIHFQRMAVTEDQIVTMDLPTRPTKKSDGRSKSFEGESVEVDAIPPDRIKLIVRECIEQHIDFGALVRLERVEAAERATLQQIMANLQGVRQ